MKTKNLTCLVILACLILAAPMAAANSETILVSCDNELNSRTPDAVKNSSLYISIGVSTTYGNEKMRYIGKADISSLDPSREIKSVAFKMDRVSNSWDHDYNYSLYEVTEAWNSAIVTWNNQPMISGRSQPGIFSSADNLLTFDVTELANFWINNPSANHGFMIVKTQESSITDDNYGLFASADYPVGGAETRPYLEIVYNDSMQPISDLTARAKDTKVQLVWTPVPDAKNYNIYRKDSGMPDFLPIATGHITDYATYLDESPKISGVYAYMVRWTSANSEESPDSNIVSATIGGVAPVFSWIVPHSIVTVFDLGKEKVVGGARSEIYPDAVEISTDGVNWVPVSYAVQEEDLSFVGILFSEPISARYIRVSETMSYPSVYVAIMPGDLNGDGVVCQTDLSILLAYRNKPASECPECDLDRDGTITVLDARKLVLMCTNPRCAC